MQDSQTQLTMTQAVLGTPEYMSPEQARGDADIDRRTDLYSAGVVLYEMLTGRTPFRADTPSATIHRILHEEPRDPRKLEKAADPVLASLALRLMSKRREDRFESADEAMEALEDGDRVPSLERRRRKRRRGLATLAVSALVLIAAAWIWSAAVRTPEIVNVKPDENSRHAVQVQYGDDITWKKFQPHPDILADLKAHVSGVAILDAYGDGRQIVVVTLEEPLGGGSDVVIAFSPDGVELWRQSLTPDENDWPDCGGLQAPWICPKENGAPLALNIDGQPGEELIVVAVNKIDCYPASISVLDPREDGAVRCTFMHLGHFAGLLPVDAYFPDGAPALVAWGFNNKLDGWGDPVKADYDEPRETRYPTVGLLKNPCVRSVFALKCGSKEARYVG